LDTIKIPIFLKVDHRRKDIILGTNPERIYLENVRSYYNTSTFMARTLCNMAVKDGKFIKMIGLQCPNTDCERIIKSFDKVDSIEPDITCDNCEIIGNENFHFKTGELKKVEFYQLAH
jgi:hypothetical protein